MKGQREIQKRLWSVLLISVLLLGCIVLPAMAADAEKAGDRMTISTSLDDAENTCWENITLYMSDIGQNITMNCYRVIASDTEITVSAVSKDSDYFGWVNHRWLIKGSDGVYREYQNCLYYGCSLRENGSFMYRTINEEEDAPSGQAMRKLSAGESVTFTGKALLGNHEIDLANAICVVEVGAVYSEGGRLHDSRNLKLYKLDDQKATELSAQQPADPSQPFTDVASADWFYDDVKYVYENGLMNGTSDTKFSPYSTLTRGMVVTILHRMEGEPEAAYSGTFSDVPDGTWYTKGVEWAASVGVVNGYPNGKFGPGDPVTREQLAAILYRYAQYKGYDTTASDNLSGCSDSASVSAYAVSAAQWAVGGNMLLTENGKLRPTEAANRAEVAAAMASFHAAYVK